MKTVKPFTQDISFFSVYFLLHFERKAQYFNMPISHQFDSKALYKSL